MKKISRRSFITVCGAAAAAMALTGPGSLYYEFCFFCGFFRCIQRSNFLCRIYG